MESIDKDEDLNLIINDYWKEMSEENEYMRFSDRSRGAFQFLKRVYRYHEYHKRDGAIINKVVADEDQVHELIVEML